MTRSQCLHRCIAYQTPSRFRSITSMADASVSKLPSPLKDLVLGAKPDFGKSDSDKAEISSLIEKVSQGDIVKPEGVKVRTRP